MCEQASGVFVHSKSQQKHVPLELLQMGITADTHVWTAVWSTLQKVPARALNPVVRVRVGAPHGISYRFFAKGIHGVTQFFVEAEAKGI